MKGISKARALKNSLITLDYLDEVELYAYGQACPGLSVEECETLENLCHKAAIGLESEICGILNDEMRD